MYESAYNGQVSTKVQSSSKIQRWLSGDGRELKRPYLLLTHCRFVPTIVKDVLCPRSRGKLSCIVEYSFPLTGGLGRGNFLIFSLDFFFNKDLLDDRLGFN